VADSEAEEAILAEVTEEAILAEEVPDHVFKQKVN
jgi:phosphotransferase system IIA component